MALGIGSYGVGLLAGVLSTLSPCVLPIIPILVGSAASTHARAPLVLAGGLALSYAVVGTTLAWAGASLGLDATVFRAAGAVVLGLLGMVMLSGNLQQRFAVATSGFGNAGNSLLSRLRLDGLWGQFIVGLVLGVVWSPCVGPTLGAAILLASQGRSLPQAALMMGVFGVGAALPVVVLAHVSRTAMLKVRGQLMQAGKAGKTILGLALVAVALFILSGLDRPLEAWLVEHTPVGLAALTTRF